MTRDGSGRAPDAPEPNWPAVLDDLEQRTFEAAEALRGNRVEEIASWGRRNTDWIPPISTGPVPEDLRERAARLLQHQLAVAEELAERILQSRKHRDAAARMSYGPARPASYIDQAL